ncbi:MAG: tetratricopeptide repeat protein [Spirochaetia bacterium]
MKIMIFFIVCIFLCVSTSIIFAQDLANNYFENGKAEYFDGDYKNAIEDFLEVINLDPKNKEAYCYIGLAKYQLSDYKKAIEYFTKAIETDPEYVDAYYNRTLAKFYVGDFAGSIADNAAVICCLRTTRITASGA